MSESYHPPSGVTASPACSAAAPWEGVLLAKDPVLERDVAVKLLRDDLSLPPEQRTALLERMRQEARASARVRTPTSSASTTWARTGVRPLPRVRVRGGRDAEGSLAARPARPRGSAAKLARQIAGALHTAHTAGVLHRDIKPENIILTRYRRENC